MQKPYSSKYQRTKKGFISTKFNKSKANIRHSNKLNINDDEWKYIYTLSRNLVKDNKIIIMQYQILHNYMLTNKTLFKMKMINSGTCNLCNMYEQNLYHLLFDCFIIKKFWFEFESWFNTKYNCNINVLIYDVIFGHKSRK